MCSSRSYFDPPYIVLGLRNDSDHVNAISIDYIPIFHSQVVT